MRGFVEALAVIAALGLVSGCAGTAVDAEDAGDAAPAPVRGATPIVGPGDEALGDLARFQGTWEFVGYDSGEAQTYIRIEGRDFHANGVHGRYLGEIAVRSDTDPKQIDFLILDCGPGCGRQGKTSEGIWDIEDDGTLVLAADETDLPRPESLEKSRGRLRVRPIDPLTNIDLQKPVWN